MATPKNKSVIRAFQILSAFSGHRSELSLKEIAQITDINPATAHRFMLTLEEIGAVVRNSNNRFQLGLQIAELARTVTPENLLIDTAQPHVNELVECVGETVHLGVLSGRLIQYVARGEPKRALQISVNIGATVPPHASAAGKILLADLEDKLRDEILNAGGFERFTDRTIENKEQYQAELRKVRSQGFALDDEELEEGLRCIAVPIRDAKEKTIASLSISAPVMRMSPEKMEQCCTELISHAEQIRRRLYVENRVLKSKAPPRGQFPHVKRVGDFLFVSGTSARRSDNTFDGATVKDDGEVILDIRRQTRSALENIRDILNSVGASLSDIVQMDVFLTDMADYDGLNETYADFFDMDGPSRTTVAVEALPHPHQLLMVNAQAYKI